jgi:hypothetical protein
MREFGLIGFVEHLGAIAVEMVTVESEALERAAILVEAEAKAAIGEYQDQAGPFAAWPELAEATKSDRAKQGYPDNEPELRTGALRDSIEHKVAGHEAQIGSDSEIMEWQELGTDRMPARSILGGAAFRKSKEVAAELGESVHLALIGEEVHKGRLAIR